MDKDSIYYEVYVKCGIDQFNCIYDELEHFFRSCDEFRELWYDSSCSFADLDNNFSGFEVYSNEKSKRILDEVVRKFNIIGYNYDGTLRIFIDLDNQISLKKLRSHKIQAIKFGS